MKVLASISSDFKEVVLKFPKHRISFMPQVRSAGGAVDYYGQLIVKLQSHSGPGQHH